MRHGVLRTLSASITVTHAATRQRGEGDTVNPGCSMMLETKFPKIRGVGSFLHQVIPVQHLSWVLEGWSQAG